MKLSKEALRHLNDNNRVKNFLAAEFDCTEMTVRRWIEDNKEDGDLTKASAVRIIKQHTGLTDEQILTEAEKKAS